MQRNNAALRLLPALLLGGALFTNAVTAHAQSLMYTPNVSVQGCNVPKDLMQPPIRVHTEDGKRTSFAVSSSGTVEFGPGASIDFNDVRTEAGPRVAYVVIYLQGMPALLPVYAFPDQ